MADNGSHAADLVKEERDRLTVDEGGEHRRRDQVQGVAAQEIAEEQRQRRQGGVPEQD